MPFALIIIGAVLLVAGVRNTTQVTSSGGPGLYPLIKNDFTTQNGQTGFIAWLIAILIVGSIGYIAKAKTFSNAFLALILIGMILVAYKKNPQIFSNFNSAVGISNSSVTGAPSVSSGEGISL